MQFETMNGLKRTHMCGTLSKDNNGEEVVLCGWVARNRKLGGLDFVTLRDRSGIIQLSFNDETDSAVFEKATALKSEYVIAIRGTVALRTEKNINPDMKTGEIEVLVSELRVLNGSETPPFYIEENIDTNDALRLKYRYLDIRRPDMQRNLMLRHKIVKVARDYFDDNGFLEIETPILTKSTPEGARDYLVPSRVHPGKFYALPQSPQQYKQLLMLGGYDRYFQVARCFRDEDLRADRQPEFTQLDMELSFIDIDTIIEINEGFLKRVFKKVLNIDVKTPFVRLPYREAMERFGSDKPDTRFGMEFVNISDEVRGCGFKVFSDAVENGGSVRCIVAEGLGEKLTRKTLDSLTEYVKTYRAKGMAWIVVEDGKLRSQITKFLDEDTVSAILKKTGAKVGDGILIVADKDSVVYDALGNLRLEVARRFDLIDKNKFNFLWVTEFPLLEYSEEENRYVAMHHPFTHPFDEDIDKLETAPGEVRAKAYDIILNGSEIGGGSLRIFNSELQEKMFAALGFTHEEAWERFGYLMEAFKYGTPPHGGLAYGLDRLAMIMAGCDSIRDVIAFPKVQNASELMMHSPDVVDKQQLDDLSIAITRLEEE
ncbi:MAG: aspartate--tRNA ligase [Clostridiales bacterium]|nr:aspartate--tRNA ligase [Clostridiales bacterium]